MTNANWNDPTPDPAPSPDSEILRQLEAIEAQRSQPAEPTPDLTQGRRKFRRLFLIGATVGILGTLGISGLIYFNQQSPEPAPVRHATEATNAQLSEYITENRISLNENVGHINRVSEANMATHLLLTELIESLNQLNPPQLHANQQEVIAKVKEIDTRVLENEEQLRAAFQHTHTVNTLSNRVDSMISNHNQLVENTQADQRTLADNTRQLGYLNQAVQELLAQNPAADAPEPADVSVPRTEAELIAALAECRNAMLPKPGSVNGNPDQTAALAARIRQRLADGDTSLYNIGRELAECLNPSPTPTPATG